MRNYITWTLILLLGLFASNSLLAQQLQKPQAPKTTNDQISTSHSVVKLNRPGFVQPAPNEVSTGANYENYSGALKLPNRWSAQEGVKIIKDKSTGLPISMSGSPKGLQNEFSTTPEEAAKRYLKEMKNTLKIENPAEEFVVRKQQVDLNGVSHLRMQQKFKGVPVFASEVIVHVKEGQVDFFNGRYYPTPDLATTSPSIKEVKAIEIVRQEVAKITTLKELTAIDKQFLPEGKQFKSQLVIYHIDGKADKAHLAWQITTFPNISDRYEYFVDAQSGDVLHFIKNSCKLFHDHAHGACSAAVHLDEKSSSQEIEEDKLLGKETATAVDLNNQNRLINVYSVGTTYYMIDASRNMHDAQNAALSNFPNEPAGCIWTLDAGNTSPQGNFDYDHVKSFNNSWNDRTSVSAHYNGGVAYEYFENVHNRNSINGSGGNIISLINVADENGQDMDNAFWNGAAMFYGNGAQAFDAPLAKALDVAGHEMSHGVIQATANLTYQNQEGALNESFADIFGAMMDRDDWQIGEEVSNSSIFPSGTMRDMQDPNNGGNSNDFYWQPKHMDEFVNLPNTPQGDYGGVHINSGIPNHAYYLFATAIGKDKAEQVFYKALDDYLVASSQFVDLRIAVLKAAEDLYGTVEVNAAATAFDQVGIAGGPGGDYETDVNQNPGDDLVLYADLSRMDIYYPQDPNNPEQLTATGQSSRPSVSDDGSFVVFVDDQKRLKGISVDWTSGGVQEFFLESTPQTVFRNIVTSKDGSKVAFLYELIGTDRDKEITVFDFNSQTSQTFELYNPTTSNDGSSTGDVQFADVMEFDVTGEYILYDAFNELTGIGGEDISYWDIGIMKVWNNAANGFDNGVVSKIFSGLQENESVGNPTFAKNSPYIIAFDYFAVDNTGQETYVLYGANIEQNEIGVIDDQIFKLSFPSYSPYDDQILYSDINNGQDIIITQDLSADKIGGQGNWVGLVGDAEWAVWFANGQRDLVSTNDLDNQLNLKLFPNPFSEQLTLNFNAELSGDAQLEMIDVLGRSLYSTQLEINTGANQLQLPNLDISPGTYTLRLVMDGAYLTQQVVKAK